MKHTIRRGAFHVHVDAASVHFELGFHNSLKVFGYGRTYIYIYESLERSGIAFVNSNGSGEPVHPPT